MRSTAPQTADRTTGHRPPAGASVLLSAGDFAALMDELDSLRAQVAALAERAGAGIGSIVTVEERGGRSVEYELVTASACEPRRLQVALDTPTGRALSGARPGDFVRLALPNGRTRRVRVVSVTPYGPPAAPPGRCAGARASR